MASQVGAHRESVQHPLDLLEHLAAVGIRPEETEDFVQPLYVFRARQAGSFQLHQQGKLARGHLATVLRLQALVLS